MEELKRMGIRYSRTRRNRITVRLPGIGFREVKARIDVKTTIAELLVETERMIREKNLSPKSRENLLYNLNLLRVQTMKNVENEEVSNVK
jgi:hypothetical protein